VAGLFGWLFTGWLGRWRGMAAAFMGMAIYAVLAGASAAVVRAAIMGILATMTGLISRPLVESRAIGFFCVPFTRKAKPAAS